MEKKRFFVLGLAALFLLLIAASFTGCDSNDPSYDNEWVFYNQSSYTIQVDITTPGISPSSFTFGPGKEKKVGSNTYGGTINFSAYTTDAGSGRGIRWDGNTNSFYDK